MGNYARRTERRAKKKKKKNKDFEKKISFFRAFLRFFFLFFSMISWRLGSVLWLGEEKGSFDCHEREEEEVAGGRQNCAKNKKVVVSKPIDNFL